MIVNGVEIIEDPDYVLVHPYYRLIRIADMSYPKVFSDVRAEFPLDSFPIEYRSDYLEQGYGYGAVREAPIPEGDVVTEITPVKDPVTGHWFRTYSVRAFTPEEFEAEMKFRKLLFLLENETSFERDLTTGIDVLLEGETQKAKIRPEDITMLMITKQRAQENPQGVYTVFTKTRLYKDIDATRAIALIDTILDAYSSFSNMYYDFLSQGLTSTTLTGIPKAKSTFLEA